MSRITTLKSFLLFVFFSIAATTFGQAITLSNESKTSVITCGTGNESYSLFGHTAIRITDASNNLDVVYNYGAFDFDTPNFVAKFAKGDLQYFVIANSYADFINSYTNEKRSVYQQDLLLPLSKKQSLFDNLNKTLLSEDRYYTYKFIDKNCTSMVVDIINKTLNTQAITKKGAIETTYRAVLYPYFDGHFYEKLGTSIIFGKKVDENATKIFLPFELKNSLAKTTFEGKPLAAKSQTLLNFEKETSSSWWNNSFTYLGLLLLIIILNKKQLDHTFLFIMGILGLFFLFMGIYSFHRELEYNYNTLLFNPLFLILLLFLLAKNKIWTYRMAVTSIVLALIYGIFIATKAPFLIILPLLTTTIWVLIRVALRNMRKIPIII